jgi:hypothetical protein
MTPDEGFHALVDEMVGVDGVAPPGGGGGFGSQASRGAPGRTWPAKRWSSSGAVEAEA